jgi:hypothetical protein
LGPKAVCAKLRVLRAARGLLRFFNDLHEDSTIYRKTKAVASDPQLLRYALCIMESGFQCASCGEWNTTSVDESAGRRQSYVEDCQVCCKPNVLRVEYDTSGQEFFITAELE